MWLDQPFTNLKKLFASATKHDHSAGHKNAMQMDQLSKACTAPTGHGTVLDQHRTFANEQSVSDKDVMKKMFDGALFLFRNEISHTTNWEPLIQFSHLHLYLLQIPKRYSMLLKRHVRTEMYTYHV